MEEKALEIIGRADGPTAIFLSASGDAPLIIACVLLALIAAGMWLYGRKRKHKEK